MKHIDIETLKEVHNALDDLTLGNYELAHKQLNKIVGNEQLYIPFVNKQRELLYALADELDVATGRPTPPSMKTLLINKILGI
jgi:hypothetical protein